MTTCLPIKRSSDHLISWIKVNQIKQNLNEEILSDSIQQILQLFGSNANLLHFLTTHSSKAQLDAIHQILEGKIQKFKENKERKQNKNIEKQKIKILQSSNNFVTISNESITNICSFLSYSQFRTFKLT
eukprot:263570_1